MAVVDEILTAELKLANMVYTNVSALMGGSLKANWWPAIKASRGVNSVLNRYSIGDTSSAAFQSAYACLTAFVGTYGGGAIDPNAQNPGVVIDVTQVVNFNSDKIYFNDQAPVTLANYNTTYKQLYGNNPILAIYVPTYTQDEATAPTITYQDDDPAKDILTITWDYPFPVSGYIQISGTAPGSGGSTPSGTNNAVNFTYDETALVYDAPNDQYYLPLMLPSNKIPVYAKINGISQSLTFDSTFTPTRLYGFGNNSAQVIVVTILTVG